MAIRNIRDMRAIQMIRVDLEIRSDCTASMHP